MNKSIPAIFAMLTLSSTICYANYTDNNIRIASVQLPASVGDKIIGNYSVCDHYDETTGTANDDSGSLGEGITPAQLQRDIAYGSFNFTQVAPPLTAHCQDNHYIYFGYSHQGNRHEKLCSIDTNTYSNSKLTVMFGSDGKACWVVAAPYS